ncbi:DUF3906 family protein [Fictibacillus phosphorivorans]|uniref:DUF3906 family protein n=1 Tax=Fictibacillus phosphorivorans TaxID=1221500 RepID=UPI00203FD351|nr:DUF3906 family protein [Fictibacillus phosphorivorans]MCM3718844.1 DUF3906 family protein [Fictibacillus phosphorivorans]MCM3776466.1 DUF3906 family protein [Fictibacillus phosphorivorans]
MYLYRFEVNLKSEVVPVVIAASTDEQAFQLVDVELEKYFLKEPDIEEISLYEKKKIRSGNGFVLYERETLLNS